MRHSTLQTPTRVRRERLLTGRRRVRFSAVLFRMQILLMGTSNLLPGNAAWRRLAGHGLAFADYNAWSRLFLGAEALPAGVDLVAWVVCLEDLFPAALIADLENADAGASERLAEEVASATQPLEQFLRDSSAAHVLVAWSYRQRASAVRWAERVPGWTQLSRLWESRLRDFQSQSSRVLAMPLRSLFASQGLDRCLDARNLYFAHCHFSFQGLDAVARDRGDCRTLDAACEKSVGFGLRQYALGRGRR